MAGDVDAFSIIHVMVERGRFRLAFSGFVDQHFAVDEYLAVGNGHYSQRALPRPCAGE